MADGFGGSVRFRAARVLAARDRSLFVNAGPDDSRSCDDAKLEARATARAARAAAFAALPDAGARVRDRFIAELLPALGLPDRRTFSAYVPMRDEIDSLPLVRSLIGRGLTAAMPCVVGPGKPLLFRRWDIGAPLADRPFGLLEPMDDAPAVEPELLLVPLLAFDRRGHRLGYGRGYYDRTLASLRARRPIVAVGLAFAAQEMLSLPVGARDQRLDWVVTEQAAIRPEA